MLKTLKDTAIKPRPDFNQLRKAMMRDGMPEYVPFYELFANYEIMEPAVGKKLPDPASIVEFYYLGGYDYVPVEPTLHLVLGSLIDTTSNYPIKDRKTFDAYQWPDPDSIDYTKFDLTAAALPDGMMMIAQPGGVFELAEGLMGYTGLCFAMADDPALVEAIFERIDIIYQGMYTKLAGMDKVGAVMISDDLGFKTQTLVSPAYLRKYVLPLHKKQTQIIHAAGKPAMLHSCGQLESIMEDIIEDVRIDARHSYEDAIMPVTEFKKRYGGRIGILGGFDVDRLCRSTEQEVRNHTRALLRECGSDGGYALGSGNSIAPYVPIENYLAMIDEAWRLREA